MTVSEIAQMAGVSTGTVDRVIHNRGRVSEETKEKILKIINENGYSPDPIARFLKKKCEFKIGVLIPAVSEESGYWQAIYNGIESAAVNDYAAFGFKIELFGFRRPNRESLTEQFYKMMDSKCSAYIIAPIMQEEILFLLTERKPEVPYCFIDSPLPGVNPLCTVAQNPFKAGYLAGKLTRLSGKGDGTYAVIKTFAESYNQNERTRGFASYFVQDDNSRAVQKIAAGSTENDISEAVEKLVIEHNDLRGICIVNSEAHFVGAKLCEMQMKDKIVVTGFDLVDQNIVGIKSDMIDCLISQNPEEQGGMVLKEVYKKLILGKNAEKSVNIPLNIMFKENIDFN